MKRVLFVVVLGLLAGVALQLYARLYPHDFAGFHRERPVPEGGDGTWTLSNGVTVSAAIGEPPAAVLARLDEVIRATPRTSVVAGALDEGKVTYVTRTSFWGFPDLTYVQVTPEGEGTRLLIRGSSVIGGYDWGVNHARVIGWLEAAGLPVPPDIDGSP